MKVLERDIISRAIEEGIELGWNRAHKHFDRPTPPVIKDSIDNAIWECLDEVIIFETRGLS